MPNIFISYRRADADLLAHSICGRLRQEFGDKSVFIDVDAIPPGIDFRHHLREQINRCDIMLAVIAENWLDIRGADGKRRLDDPQDFVRIEIEQALARNILVIPLVYGQARMPAESELPVSMRHLAFRNAVMVRSGRDIGIELKKVIESLRALPASTAQGSLPSERRGTVAARLKSSIQTLWQRWGRGPVAALALGSVALLALVVWIAFASSLFRASPGADRNAEASKSPPVSAQSGKVETPSTPEITNVKNSPIDPPKADEKPMSAEDEEKITSRINGNEPMRWIRSRNTGRNVGPDRDGVWNTGKVYYNAENITRFLVEPSPSGTDLYCQTPSDDIYTEQLYGDVRVELEFLITPFTNSGVFLMGEYEINILDRDRSGEILKGPPPMVLVRKPAGEWQSFDITFRAPRFHPDGRKLEDARFVKVIYNGQVIYENVAVPNITADQSCLTGKESAKGPLMLQGAFLPPIAFRNIRITPLDLTLNTNPN